MDVIYLLQGCHFSKDGLQNFEMFYCAVLFFFKHVIGITSRCELLTFASDGMNTVVIGNVVDVTNICVCLLQLHAQELFFLGAGGLNKFS